MIAYNSIPHDFLSNSCTNRDCKFAQRCPHVDFTTLYSIREGDIIEFPDEQEEVLLAIDYKPYEHPFRILMVVMRNGRPDYIDLYDIVLACQMDNDFNSKVHMPLFGPFSIESITKNLLGKRIKCRGIKECNNYNYIAAGYNYYPILKLI